VGAWLHLDAVQAAPYLDLAGVPWDLLTLSAHRLGGPQGVGALVRRGEVPLAPLLLGGSQQGGLRPGTVPVALAAGFGAAAEAALAARPQEAVRLAVLREAFALAFMQDCAGLVPLGARAVRPEQALPHVLPFGLLGLAGDEVVQALDEAGVAAASASACLSGARSPTLDAIGAAPGLALLRFSLGWTSRADELAVAARRAAVAIARLRALPAFERRAGIFERIAAEAGVTLGPRHWEAARVVFAFHEREGVLPGTRSLGRLLPGGPALDTLFPYGLGTLCAWLGLPVPLGGCRPFTG
jgi:cysteine desulfurase